MDRRTFLRRSALVAAGAVAMDQFDLLDKLGWKRKFFPGVSFGQGPMLDVGARAGSYSVTYLIDGYGQVVSMSKDGGPYVPVKGSSVTIERPKFGQDPSQVVFKVDFGGQQIMSANLLPERDT